MKTDVFELLKTWCDSLIALQIDGTGQPALDGAILCPACQTVHGRCGELVYPLLALADRTGQPRYLTAARRLFDWSESLLCSDGSMYNDGQSAWNGITAFAAVALCDALRLHGHLLPPAEHARWQDRLRRHGDWILTHIDETFNSNINYNAAAAGSMALLGNYFDRTDYRDHARRMAAYVQQRVSADGLFYGEGKPIDRQTAKGCRPVDIGYNVEESLPLMLLYAEQSGDAAAHAWAVRLLKRHLDFMLPDGGWDNSFGTRNYKWTYWGSRTSEGCAEAYAVLGQTDPQCAAAAARSLALMECCTVDGLLAGGPDYAAVGARPCVHHAFSHARTLAAILDRGLTVSDGAALPCQSAPALQYYPTLDSYRVHLGGWHATVTGYDFEYMPGGHASGGALSLLWHESTGPIVASGMTRYHLFEAHNMQQLTDKALQASLTPRIENGPYASCLDYAARLTAREGEGCVTVTAEGTLRREDQTPLPGGAYRLEYTFTPQAVTLKGWTAAEGCRFVLPAAKAAVLPAPAAARPVFSLAGGLAATEHAWPLAAEEPLTVTLTV